VASSGIALKLDYVNKHVDLSMPGYINNALHKFHHPMPTPTQYAPHNWNAPAYGQHIQYALLSDAHPPANSQAITRAQCIVGTLLYNARAVDTTLLVPLSNLASQLSTATSTTIDSISHLLDYCSTHPESSIRYYASNMQLKSTVMPLTFMSLRLSHELKVTSTLVTKKNHQQNL
jgi:hypothetical protein